MIIANRQKKLYKIKIFNMILINEKGIKIC